MVDVGPTYVNVAGATFGNAGVTFGGPVVIHNDGDAVLTLYADADGPDSNDNPHINFKQDASANEFAMGMVGAANTVFTDSRQDIPYVKSYWGMDIATGNTKTVELDQSGKLWLLGPGGLSADAGATFGAPVNLQDKELTRPKLKDYAETVNAIGTITDDFQVNIEDGNVQTVTIGGDCEVDFVGFPATGIAGTVTLIVTNGGAHTVSWLVEVKWPGDNAPALTSSGGVDIVSFMTIDGGNNIYGFVGGINFS